MDDPFAAYLQELELRDLDPKTRLCYAQIVSAYQRWLHSDEVNPETAKGFLAQLRQQGYKPASVALYYTVLKLFLDFLGMKLHLKIRKPQILPPMYDPRDMELLLEEAKRGRPGQTQAVRRRNYNLIAVLMDTGLRTSWVMPTLPPPGYMLRSPAEPCGKLSRP